MARPFLIDTDGGSDDALALLMALNEPTADIIGITAVSGNVSVTQAAQNALYVLELCDRKVPVYIGAKKPMHGPNVYMTQYHGEDGLGDHGFRPVQQLPRGQPAVDAIIENVLTHPGLTFVALGPLTNLANALDRKPQLATEIGRCVIMGGAPCGAGNITPVAEYNFWVDPEAAKLVMGSKLDIELIGLHLSRGDAALNSAEIGEIAALPGARAQFALASTSKLRKAYSARTGTDSLSLPDPVAMAMALDPTIAIQWGEHFVDVETRSKLTRGMCVVDWNDIAGDEINRPVWQSLLEDGRKAKICWKIDQRRWKQAFFCVFV